MPRGRLLSDPQAPQALAYEPPQASRASADASPEARAEEAARAGFERGLARGQAEAKAALDAELKRLRDRFGASCAQLVDLERRIVDESKAQVLELALVIAARVIRERIEAGDPVAERIAAEVLADAPRGGTKILRVHPADHAAMIQALPQLGEPGTVVLETDPSIAPGGIVVETPLELVDARVETALAAVRDALAETR